MSDHTERILALEWAINALLIDMSELRNRPDTFMNQEMIKHINVYVDTLIKLKEELEV